MLPYNLLLHKSARESLGIDLTNQIVIVDEAHSMLSLRCRTCLGSSCYIRSDTHLAFLVQRWHHVQTVDVVVTTGRNLSSQISSSAFYTAQSFPRSASLLSECDIQGHGRLENGRPASSGEGENPSDEHTGFRSKIGTKGRRDQFTRDRSVPQEEQG